MFTVEDVLVVANALPADGVNPHEAWSGGGCCHYNEKLEPSCVAGVIVSKLDPSLFKSWTEKGNDGAYNGVFIEVPGIENDFTNDAVCFVQDMQTRADQDDTTWGEALAYATRQHEERLKGNG